MPVAHYENFPVASWLLPARLRPPIEAIYAFARSADDIADEGDAGPDERLEGLGRYLLALDAIEAGERPSAPPFARLADAVREYHLPLPLLRDLIDAFRQDVTKARYATYAELLDYARRSANPIGRLVLHVFDPTGDRLFFPRGGTRGKMVSESNFGNSTPTPFFQSDAICSALQLINFWQDVAVDWRKGRLYLPQEDLERFGVDERQIDEGRADGRWQALMKFECERARELLRSGGPLGKLLPGRLGLEIRATINGGSAILDRIDAVSGDVFRHRPVLGALDWMKIVAKTITAQ